MVNKLLLCLGTFLVAPVFGTTVNYALSAGSDTITFSLPQIPTAQACNFSVDCFSLYPVGLTVDGTSIANGEVSFYTTANHGGLTVVNLATNTLLVNNDGPSDEVLFTGTVTNPTLETFSNLQLVATSAFGPQYNEAFILNATTAASTAPEPSPVIMIIVGGLAIAGICARRLTSC
jgi:hypothetical protein